MPDVIIVLVGVRASQSVMAWTDGALRHSPQTGCLLYRAAAAAASLD